MPGSAAHVRGEKQHVARLRAGLGLALWLLAALPLDAAGNVAGMVRDSSGAPVADAHVVLMTAGAHTVGTARSDMHRGVSAAEVPARGRFLVVTTAEGLGESRLPCSAAASAPAPLDVRLHVGPLQEEVTVTASRSTIDDLRLAGQPVTVIDAEESAGAGQDVVVAQAVEGEAGVPLQRTSPTMAGVFVRGLTGNKVNVFIDGVRYSNGAQRGGVNTFLDLIELESLESIEIVRGPSSAQYGSDALGGSIQFLSRAAAASAAGRPGVRRIGRRRRRHRAPLRQRHDVPVDDDRSGSASRRRSAADGPG